ncbi:MAG: hypothetical protein M1503_03185 [Thaumarchaeota archaeon]|nr:hypothetical protein [Nitrososphaerota archaeon]MCL5317256.1 hypothetical protein [Nitrososphaerota archaeon]
MHEFIEKYRGSWNVKTKYGEIVVSLRPYRIGYGSRRGRPDELIEVELRISILGEWASIVAPILIEAETKGGLSSAEEDLSEFSKRTRAGEQDSHLSIPYLVIGKKRQRTRTDTVLPVKVKAVELPEGIIKE